MFTGEAGDEAAAADLTASLKTPEDVEKVAPFGGVGFAGEEVAEEDSITVEELASEGLKRSVGAARFFNRGWGGAELIGEE